MSSVASQTRRAPRDKKRNRATGTPWQRVPPGSMAVDPGRIPWPPVASGGVRPGSRRVDPGRPDGNAFHPRWTGLWLGGGAVESANRGGKKRTVVLFSRVVHPELSDAFRVYRGCAGTPGTSAALPCAFFFFRVRGRVPPFPYRGLDRPPGVRGILPECVTPSFETYRPSRWKM